MPSRWGPTFIRHLRRGRLTPIRLRRQRIITSRRRCRRQFRLTLVNQPLASKLASVQGLLFVNKPPGWTSFDAVNYIRRILAREKALPPKKIKVGHSGTLDPFASGLLIILIGGYTKRANQFTKLDKEYEVTLKLGEISSTGDPTGEIKPVLPLKPDVAAVKSSLKRFTGKIDQLPPSYSAIKVGGQRAYLLARAGRQVVLKRRPVTIHKLELISYKYPYVKLEAAVSSGTYIRSLVEDMGKELGTGAYTLNLKRLGIGPFKLSRALDIKSLNAKSIEQN